MKVAFDFGITNTDIVIQDNNELMFHTVPSQKIDSSFILKLLSEMNLNISQISHIAVTGGKSSDLHH
jgi:activator of 2-hydroxyglutaryl-CoA dehydratase